jgi:predicted lipoprotein with Yx(FWY)xxD motif
MAATRHKEAAMRSFSKVLIPTIAGALVLAACGSSSSTSTTASSQPATAASARTQSVALVKTASNAKLGMTVLVNAHGLTLYHLSGEGNGKFICTSAACLKVWHPLTEAGAIPAGPVSSLSQVKRPGGPTQVAYKGMPLYAFAQDTAPGQANGQGIKDVGTWSAVSTSRTPAAGPAKPAKPAKPAGGGYAY